MKSQALTWVAVAGIAGSGLWPVGMSAWAESPTPPSQNPPAALDNRNAPGGVVSQALTLPAGIEQKELSSESGIKSGLVKITDRAITKGDFNSLLGELSRQDRERAREYKGADQKQLDGVIDQIQKAWKNKYNQEFEVNDKNLVFDSQFQIVQGTVVDPSVAIDSWPAPACSSLARTAADRDIKLSDEQKQIDKAKLTKGRDVAVVRIPAGNGMPDIDVSMIFHYVDFWRVDVPNDRTGEQIYNDLLTHLNYINDHQNQWPDKVEDGYRMVARHAAAALYGVPTTPNNSL